jgi:hypothetical protein
MRRRDTLKLMGAAAVIGGLGVSGFAFAQDQKTMVTVVKIAGIPVVQRPGKRHQEGRDRLQPERLHGRPGQCRPGAAGETA